MSDEAAAIRNVFQEYADAVNAGDIGRSQSVEEIRSGAFKAESMSIDGVKVRVFGNVAVVTYGQSEKSQTLGKDSSGRTLWTDIFVNRNGQWQLAANHGSRVDEPKK